MFHFSPFLEANVDLTLTTTGASFLLALSAIDRQIDFLP
jgi:hypothetical protein